MTQTNLLIKSGLTKKNLFLFLDKANNLNISLPTLDLSTFGDTSMYFFETHQFFYNKPIKNFKRLIRYSFYTSSIYWDMVKQDYLFTTTSGMKVYFTSYGQIYRRLLALEIIPSANQLAVYYNKYPIENYHIFHGDFVQSSLNFSRQNNILMINSKKKMFTYKEQSNLFIRHHFLTRYSIFVETLNQFPYILSSKQYTNRYYIIRKNRLKTIIKYKVHGLSKRIRKKSLKKIRRVKRMSRFYAKRRYKKKTKKMIRRTLKKLRANLRRIRRRTFLKKIYRKNSIWRDLGIFNHKVQNKERKKAQAKPKKCKTWHALEKSLDKNKGRPKAELDMARDERYEENYAQRYEKCYNDLFDERFYVLMAELEKTSENEQAHENDPENVIRTQTKLNNASRVEKLDKTLKAKQYKKQKRARETKTIAC